MSKTKLYYIIDRSNWSIKWDGLYLVSNLRKIRKCDVDFKISKDTFIQLKKHSLIHFGYQSLFFKNYKKVFKNNKIITTIFHISEEDNKTIKEIDKINEFSDLIHTSCEITKNKLISLGVNPDKIILIPLGVDNSLFKEVNDDIKILLKKKYEIPDNNILIGSFQKDGNGWGEGLEPKLIKGPDIFCNVIEKLNHKIPVFVLLSGPARGYVKMRLEKSNIGYRHIFLKNYQDISELYQILDLYLVTSRIEGGPKAILESLASGVPIISTKVGMAPDVILDGENGFLCDIENVEQISESALRVLSDDDLRTKFINNGLETVKQYDWSIIARQYYDKLYKNFL